MCASCRFFLSFLMPFLYFNLNINQAYNQFIMEFNIKYCMRVLCVRTSYIHVAVAVALITTKQNITTASEIKKKPRCMKSTNKNNCNKKTKKQKI